MRSSRWKGYLTAAAVGAGLVVAASVWVSTSLWPRIRTMVTVRADAAVGIKLTGVVRDEAGKPIAGATVAQGSSPFAADGSYQVTTTDDAGRFEIDDVQPGMDLFLTAMAPGRSPVEKRGIVSPRDQRFEFVLPPGHVMRCRILDVHGRPLAGATAAPMDWMGQDLLRPYAKGGGDLQLESGADGRIEWDSAPAGPVTICFQDGQTYRPEMETRTASAVEHVVRLRKALHVTIKAMDPESGQSIELFNVTHGTGTLQLPEWNSRVLPSDGGEVSFVDTDRNDLVRVEADGYAPATVTLPIEREQAVMTIPLLRRKGVEVTLVRPDGSPAAGAKLSLVDASTFFDFGVDVGTPTNASPAQLFTADDLGGCRIADSSGAPTPKALFVADPSGFLSIPLADLKQGARLQLKRWGEIKGTWRGEAGRNGNIQVVLESTQAPFPRVQFEEVADAEGRFDFPMVPPGKVLLMREITLYPKSTQFRDQDTGWVKTLDMKSGEVLTKQAGGTGRTLTGRVVLPDGDKPPLTESLGFVMDRLWPSPYTQEEWKALRKMSPEEQKKWRNEFAASPRGKAALNVELVWPKTHPWTNAHFPFVLKSDGTFRVDDVSPGARTLQVTVRGVDGTPIGNVRVDLTVPKTGFGTINLGDVRLLGD